MIKVMDKKYWDENGNLACVEEIKECNNYYVLSLTQVVS